MSLGGYQDEVCYYFKRKDISIIKFQTGFLLFLTRWSPIWSVLCQLLNFDPGALQNIHCSCVCLKKFSACWSSSPSTVRTRVSEDDENSPAVVNKHVQDTRQGWTLG